MKLIDAGGSYGSGIVSSGREVGGGLKHSIGGQLFVRYNRFLRPRGRRRIETFKYMQNWPLRVVSSGREVGGGLKRELQHSRNADNWRFLRPRGRRRIETCSSSAESNRANAVSSGREVGGGLKLRSRRWITSKRSVSSGREVGGGLKRHPRRHFRLRLPEVSSGREVGGGLKRRSWDFGAADDAGFLRPRGRRRIETRASDRAMRR